MMSSSLEGLERWPWLVKGLFLLYWLLVVCSRFCRKNLRVKTTTPTTSAITKSVNVKNESRARLAPIQRISETLFQKVVLLTV